MIDMSTFSTAALEQELRLRRSQAAATSRPRAFDTSDSSGLDENKEEDSDDDSLFVREQPSVRSRSRPNELLGKSTTFSSPFGRKSTAETYGKVSRQRKEQLRESAGYVNISTHEPTPGKRRLSPSCEISGIDDELIPSRYSTSAIAHQDIALAMAIPVKRRKTAAQQEGDDRRLAERLAAEEEDDLLMLMGGQWTKARSGTKGHSINLDCSKGRTKYRRVGADGSFGVGRNGESASRQSSRRRSETFDAAIARQLQKEAASRTRDCAVCSDATLIIDLPALSSCAHDADVCVDCYTAWLGSQLEENGWQEVRCPGQSCKVNLTYEEIKAYASKEVFERYDDIQARNVLSADPNFRWCKTQGCGSGQIHDVEEVGNEFVCVGCHARFCVRHEGPYHDDETCEEYEYRASGQKDRDERKKEDEASEEAVKSLAKKCPHENCGAPIQKNGGCNHITCKLKAHRL
jgi:hypothetical protein